METTEEHSSLYTICSELDFGIDPSSTSQNYQYDPSFEIFSNSIISDVEASGAIDPIFLQSDEVFSNYDEDSVQEFVEGFTEAPECAATSSFTVPPTHILPQNHHVTHYSDKYPLPNHFTALPVKGSSVQTSTVNNADSTHNKENQENFTTTPIAMNTKNASPTYYTETSLSNSPLSSPSFENKKGSRYGGSRTSYRCGKCGELKKGHQCSNSAAEPQRKTSKKRSLATSNTTSPASSEPHTPNTSFFQDVNANHMDYRSIIHQHNTRTSGALSPMSPLPNSPTASAETPQARLTPVTKSCVINPQQKSQKTASNTSVHASTSRGLPQSVFTARNFNS